MTSLEIYKKFLLKINKNDTNSNIDISKGEFVILFNEQKRRWIDEKLENKNVDIGITDLENLLEKDFKLTKVKDTKNSTDFKLPENLIKFDSSYSIARKGVCTNRPLVNWLVKSKNINVLLNNENNNPSFEYEETLCILSKGTLVVYKSDFEITECYLSYYREPIDIDLEGYITVEGKTSQTVNPDINVKQIEEIIDRCALEVSRTYESLEAFQLSQNRIQLEK